MPTCWIIAEPNGAGKTTFALEFLPNVAGRTNFVNADLIASGMSPPGAGAEWVAASRLFLRELETHTAKRHDFGFETTLAGRSDMALIKR